MSAAPAEASSVAGVVELVDALECVLDRFTPDVWSTVSPEVARGLSGRLTRVVSRVQAQKMHAARRLEEARTATSNGATSTGQLLSEEFGGDRRDEDAIVKTAITIDTRSVLQKALDAGQVTLKQSQVIAAALKRVPSLHRELVERRLIKDAQQLALKDLRHRCDRVADQWAPEPEVDRLENETIQDRERRARARARFWMRDNHDGTHTGGFTLPDAQADALRTAVEAIASPRRDHLKSTLEVDRTREDYTHRLGLGFTDLVDRLPADRLPNAGGVSATVIVQIDEKTLTEDLVKAGRLSTGTKISASQARKMACTAGLLPAVLGGDSLPLDFGSEVRLFTRHQRRALAMRDRGCAYPGCDRPPAWCEGHHLQPVSQGGDTHLDNGVLLCPFHHHVVHDQNIQTRRSPDDGVIEFRRPGQHVWKRNKRYHG